MRKPTIKRNGKKIRNPRLDYDTIEAELESIYNRYKVKNKNSRKTKGIFKRHTLIILGLLRAYTLKEASVIVLVGKINVSCNAMEWEIENGFAYPDVNRTLIFINKINYWSEVLYGNNMTNRLPENTLKAIKQNFKKGVSNRYILPSLETFLQELQKELK